MAPEAYLLIRMVDKKYNPKNDSIESVDPDSKNKSIEAIRKIEGVNKARLTYGPMDMIIAEVSYDKHFPDLVDIIKKIGNLENVWVHEVYRTEQNIKK
jgi:hypothetical protein